MRHTTNASARLQDAYHHAGCVIGESEEFWPEICDLSMRDRLRLMIGQAVEDCASAGFPYTGHAKFRSIADGQRIARQIWDHVRAVSAGWCDPHTGTIIETMDDPEDFFIPEIEPGTTGVQIIDQIEEFWYQDNPRPVKLGRFVLRSPGIVEIYDPSECTTRSPSTRPVKIMTLQSVRQFVGRWMYD